MTPSGHSDIHMGKSNRQTILISPAAEWGTTTDTGSRQRVSRISIVSSTASGARCSHHHWSDGQAAHREIRETTTDRMDSDAEAALLAHLQAVSATAMGGGSPGHPRVIRASSVGNTGNSNGAEQRSPQLYAVQQSTHSDSELRWDEDVNSPGYPNPS